MGSVPVVLEYLRQDAEDDRYLTRREKTARTLVMLPLTIGPSLLVLAREFLVISSTTTFLVLGAVFVVGTAALATVTVRTRRRARERRRRASGAARSAAREAAHRDSSGDAPGPRTPEAR